MTSVTQNTIYYLLLFVTDINGEAKTGLTITYTIYKSSDNSIVTSGNLIDLANGTYKANYTFSDVGQYYIVYNTPSNYTDEIEALSVTSEYAQESTLLRVLGLSDENKRIINTVHDTDGNITSALIKIYASASDFENDINTLATYEFSATYNTTGLMQTMGIKRLT